MLFNLVIGLNGFTVSSIIAKPLDIDRNMHVGILKKKNMIPSRYATAYLRALKEHLGLFLQPLFMV